MASVDLERLNLPAGSAPSRRAGAFAGAFAVWRRHARVWRHIFWASMASNVVQPLLFLFAFGFGLGSVIDRMDGLDYLSFVVPGMIAYAGMFAATFETSISAYARIALQNTWAAILATPVRLDELLLGEMAWAATKALIAAIPVVIVGALWGGIHDVFGTFLALIVVVLAGLCFAACGLVATAFAKNWEFFSYFFAFWVTPMFMFSGTFFSVDRFPDVVAYAAWLLPMTHMIAVVRPLTAGLPLDPVMALAHIAYLVAITLIAFRIAKAKFHKKLFD